MILRMTDFVTDQEASTMIRKRHVCSRKCRQDTKKPSNCEDRWYIGDYGDWRFTGEEYIFENSPENRFPTLDIFPKY